MPASGTGSTSATCAWRITRCEGSYDMSSTSCRGRQRDIDEESLGRYPRDYAALA